MRSWLSGQTGRSCCGTRRRSGCSAGLPTRSSAPAADHPGRAQRRAQRGARRVPRRRADLLRYPAHPQGRLGDRRAHRHERAERDDRRRRDRLGRTSATRPARTTSPRHYMAERARVVRRLGNVVADMNAQRDLEAVLDRIAGQPARADPRRRRRVRADRGRQAPAGVHRRPACPAARPGGLAGQQPGRGAA